MNRFVSISVFPTIWERIQILFSGQIHIEGLVLNNINNSDFKVSYRRIK